MNLIEAALFYGDYSMLREMEQNLRLEELEGTNTPEKISEEDETQ